MTMPRGPGQLALGVITHSPNRGSGDRTSEVQSEGDVATLKVLGSPYAQFVGGVNYTGDEGFVFMVTGGYAVLLKKENAVYVSGSRKVFQDVKPILGGGLVLSVAFGYAF